VKKELNINEKEEEKEGREEKKERRWNQIEQYRIIHRSGITYNTISMIFTKQKLYIHTSIRVKEEIKRNA